MFSKFFYILALAYSPFIIASDHIVQENFLNELGYKTTKNYKYPSKSCGDYEKPKILAVEHLYQGIKSIREIENYKKTFYRFTLIQEEYETSLKAQNRLKQITPPYQFQTNSWYSKNCSLRKGFILGNKVYLLATDAGLFKDEIPLLLNIFRNEVIKRENNAYN